MILGSLSRSQSRESEDKYIDLIDSPAVDAAQYLSDKFEINILLSDTVKNKVITGRLPLIEVKPSLNAFAWLLNCEYNFKDEIYYFGGKSIVYQIKPSNGLNEEIKSNFGDTVSTVNDKIIIRGNENEVQNISDTVDKLSVLNSLDAWIYITQVTYIKGEQVGVNAQPNIKGGSLSYNDLKSHSVTPDKLFGDPKIDIQVKNDFQVTDRKVLIDSALGCISGKFTEVVVGKQEDRAIYSAVPAGGQTSQFVSGYKSYSSGLNLKIKPFKTADGWMIISFIENSTQDTSLSKTLVQLNSNIVVQSGAVVLLGQINVDSNQKKRSGILYKLDWPWISWLLPDEVSQEKTDIFIVLGVK